MIIIFIEDCEHFDEDIDTSVASPSITITVHNDRNTHG